MGFAEVMEKMKSKSRERKEMIRQAELQDRTESIVQERKTSSNERELRGYLNEEREKSIKIQLEQMRKSRQDDINFNHNPLKTPNITNKTQWEVLKEKNMFKERSNMFQNDSCVLRNNPKLLKNNMRLMR